MDPIGWRELCEPLTNILQHRVSSIRVGRDLCCQPGRAQQPLDRTGDWGSFLSSFLIFKRTGPTVIRVLTLALYPHRPPPDLGPQQLSGLVRSAAASVGLVAPRSPQQKPKLSLGCFR